MTDGGPRASRVAVFHGKDQPLTIETVPVPALREGEILVRNEYTTLCRSDLHTFSGRRVEKTPTILGHEIVGRIEELAPGAPARDCRGADLGVGQRITWAIYASDPDSQMSRMDMPQKAPGLFKYGHEQLTLDSTLHGGLAEYCILRRHTPVIRLDAPIPLPLLALINCSVATVAGSLRLAGSVRDRRVAIAGVGMLGVLACAMCKSAGARFVAALDIDDQRLAVAKAFGADSVANLKPGLPANVDLLGAAGGEPVAAAFDYSGDPDAMEVLLGLLGIGGTAVFVGATFPQRTLQLNAEHVVRKLHTIKGLHNYNAQDLVAAVEFLEQNHRRYPFDGLVHDRFRLEEANDAFRCALESGAHRVGVRLESVR